MQDPGGGGGDLEQGEGVSPLPPCPAPRPCRPSSSHQYLQVSELQLHHLFTFFSFTLNDIHCPRNRTPSPNKELMPILIGFDLFFPRLCLPYLPPSSGQQGKSINFLIGFEEILSINNDNHESKTMPVQNYQLKTKVKQAFL